MQALEEIGYAAYIYDLMPEQLNSVLRTLDAMIATWDAKGIRLGYPLPSSPLNSSLTQETEVQDTSVEAIYTNLAMRIAARFGKNIPPETRRAAKDSYNALLIVLATPCEMQFPATLPQGQGNKPWRRANQPFVKIPEPSLDAGPDSAIDFD
jgi:hypothetical protein